MHAFVRDHKVARFVRQLQREFDPTKREALKSLLLEEENKFAFDLEELDRVERRILECQDQIPRLESLAEKLRAQGEDATLSESLLSNSEELLAIFESYRQRVLERLCRIRL